MRFACRIFLLLTCVAALTSCTAIRLDESLEDYTAEIARLQREILEDPTAQDELRDLGSIYVRTGYDAQAVTYLQRAYDLGDRNAKTLFYLGLAIENLGDQESAIDVYEQYVEVSSLSPYRRLMQGRYAYLVRERAHREIQARLAEESELSDSDIEPDLIAVFPLSYLGDDGSYELIGRGLAEMLTIDLRQVSGIRIVERARLQAVLNELKLGASDRIDPSTAPRLGKLLHAGRLVSGTFNVLQDDALRLDAAYLDSQSGDLSDLPTHSDALRNFFQLEKQLVFSLLDELNVELTEAERTRIQEIPTQNLQAFLAYCRGLRDEDARNYDAAAASFQEASTLDPSFSLARESGSITSSLVDAGGATVGVLQAAISAEPLVGHDIDLLGSRIDRLHSGVGAGLLPGPDSRKPVEEATTIGVDPTGTLPAAPPTPRGN